MYEFKENSNVYERIRPFQNSTEILQEYKFDHSEEMKENCLMSGEDRKQGYKNPEDE